MGPSQGSGCANIEWQCGENEIQGTGNWSARCNCIFAQKVIET
jgi:hypothetical protein